MRSLNVSARKNPSTDDLTHRWCEETQFALGKIQSVAERRKDAETVAHCRSLQHACVRTSTLSSVRMTQRSKRRLQDQMDSEVLQLAEKLRMVINLEMRETVWPLPDIKESTRKFGSTFMPSKYLTWLPEQPDRTPEELVGILQHQLDDLQIALDTLHKHEENS